MGKQFSELSDKHIAFIEQQKLYFVGTAADSGSVNLSPKGGDSLRVISPTQIAWLNLTGSGNESAAHVLNNPRMTLMFCAFEGAPLIVRATDRRVCCITKMRNGKSTSACSPKAWLPVRYLSLISTWFNLRAVCLYHILLTKGTEKIWQNGPKSRGMRGLKSIG